jgi:glycerophosphoryl diester phosphodiesterase
MKLLERNLVNHYRSMGKHPWSYCPDTDEEVYYSLGCGIQLMTVNDLAPPMRIRNMMQKIDR